MDSIRNFQPAIQSASTNEGKALPERKETPPQSSLKDQVNIGGNDPVMPDPIKPHKKWLFVNYVAADCNLTDFQLKNIDQQELVGSDATTHLVAYVDVGEQKNIMGDWKHCRSLYINKDDKLGELNSELIEDFGKTDMSDYHTLTKYVVDAIGKFPADHVCLVLNDHGGGFTGAMSDDGSGKNSISIPQMREALEKAQEITGKKIDILGFDACLMAESEVAYELRNTADIMMASEETENGPGWAYNTILGGSNMAEAIKTVQESALYKINVEPKDFAKIVMDVNQQNNHDIPTFSTVDLSEMEDLKTSLNDFAKTVRNSDDKDSVKQAIRDAESMGGGWAPYNDLRDIGHLADNIIANSKDVKLQEAAKDVKERLSEAVLFNQVNPQEHPKSQGLTIFAPTDKSSLSTQYTDLQFAKDTEWDEMLTELGIGGSKMEEIPEFWTDGTKRR